MPGLGIVHALCRCLESWNYQLKANYINMIPRENHIYFLFFFYFYFFFNFYFIFKLYNIVLVLPNIEIDCLSLPAISASNSAVSIQRTQDLHGSWKALHNSWCPEGTCNMFTVIERTSAFNLFRWSCSI